MQTGNGFFHVIRNLQEAVVGISSVALQESQPAMYIRFIHSRLKMAATSICVSLNSRQSKGWRASRRFSPDNLQLSIWEEGLSPRIMCAFDWPEPHATTIPTAREAEGASIQLDMLLLEQTQTCSGVSEEEEKLDIGKATNSVPHNGLISSVQYPKLNL